MAGFWMIRAGEGGHLFDVFEREGVVAIGWVDAGDLSPFTSLEQIRDRVATAYPEMKPGAIASSASMVYKFRAVIDRGDKVITYDPEKREYLLGTINGDYQYRADLLQGHPNTRKAQWDSRLSRDDLSTASKNTLGSTLTVFEPGDSVLSDVQEVLRGKRGPASEAEEEEQEEEFEIILRDTLSRSHEFIKDRILSLDPDEMETLVAALLRALGYKTRVTPKGPDQGRDVVASPDGLGFQNPRVVAEVKHRARESMGAEKIRGFVGGLRGGDRGLYVSTGGFTREARYEAERATVPVTLVDSDYLASLVAEHYEGFDSEGRSLVPLKKVYWPMS
ncbi:MAG: restriction endonuclease [Gemmatimonadota bacterium]